MKRSVLALGVAAALVATTALAQADLPGDPTGLFVSPCGKPYRAKASEPYPVAAWFAAVDTDHDGAIDAGELRKEAEAFFEELDLNKDHVITSLEVAYYERAVVPEIGASQLSALDGQARLWLAQMNQPDLDIVPGGGDQSDDRPRSRGYKPLMTGAAPYTLLGDAEPVSATDTDLNGKISLYEFRQASDRRFARLDRDGDGKLTMAELPQTMVQKLRGGGRGKGRRG